MCFSAAEEKIFVLSEEIIDRIYRFFPAPNDHNEKTTKLVHALINVIGMVLPKIDCPR